VVISPASANSDSAGHREPELRAQRTVDSNV
jgi:hypothetical protein